MKKIARITVSCLSLAVLVVIMAIPVFSATLSLSWLPSTVSVTSDRTSTAGTGEWKVNGTTINGTAKGGWLFTNYTGQGTLTFTFSEPGTFSFDYALTNANGGSLKVGDTTYSKNTSGSETITITNATSSSPVKVKVVITSKDGGGPTEGNLTNVTFVPKRSTNVTFNPVEGLSYKIGDYTVNTTTGAQTVPIDADATSITIVPTYSNAGVKIREWRMPDSTAYSHGETVISKPSEAITLTPIVADANIPMFQVKGSNINYYDWDSAFTAAAAADASGIVVVASDGTLPERNYEVPSGKTLLIPFDSAYTLCTEEPAIYDGENPPAPSVWRKLTMSNGAHITVNGAISVGGKQYSSRPIGKVTGPYGVIEMSTGSSITVNSGGFLYAWGYVAGITSNGKLVSEGAVTIKSGGTVYENFQVADWRGGTATSSMIKNDNRVFPLSQYYVQNIQVPMTLESGAIENTFTSVNVTMAGVQKAPVTFIGTGGMFVLDGENAAVVKDYDESADRLKLELICGKVNLSAVTIKLDKLQLLGSAVTISSPDYVLPLNNNITVIARNGTILESACDVAMLPGSVMILEEGSTFNVTGGNYYIYDLDQWSYDPAATGETFHDSAKNGGFCSEYNNKLNVAPHVHNRIYTRKEADLVDAKVVVNGTINVSSGAYVYTTGKDTDGDGIIDGGANITSTGNGKIVFKGAPGTASNTYQAIATGSDRTGVAYLPIPITPAKLKNAAEDAPDYTETAEYNYANVYTYVGGKWVRGPYVAATNIAVNDALDMFFYIKDDSDLWQYYKNINVSVNSVAATLETLENSPFLYRFVWSDIAAKQMCDQITVTITSTDAGKNTVTHTFQTSVKDYADTLLLYLKDHPNTTNATNLQTAMEAMLNYGAAAQKYYDYNTENLANPDLDSVVFDKATSSLTGSCSINEAWGSRLQLINKFGMHFTVSGITMDTAANPMCATISVDNGTAVPLTWITQQEGTDASGKAIYRYFFSTEATNALSIADAQKKLTVVIYNSAQPDANKIYCTITDSVASYVVRMLAGEETYGLDDSGKFQFMKDGLNAAKLKQLSTLLNALMKFADSAAACEGGYVLHE